MRQRHGDKETLNREPLHKFTPHNLGLSPIPPYRGATARYGSVLLVRSVGRLGPGCRSNTRLGAHYRIAASDDHIYLSLSPSARRFDETAPLSIGNLKSVAFEQSHHDCRRWPIFQAL